MKDYLDYPALFPKQNLNTPVFCFVSKANEIQKFAQIDRASRNHEGILKGFQRPQIANHIKEIREYLTKNDSILPNSIVIAFMQGVSIQKTNSISGSIRIEISNDQKGWIVDGQQRFTALLESDNKNFEIFVSAFICSTEEELYKQFILINNTKPLPKSLIYELIPRVKDLPNRYSSRSIAACLVEILNFNQESCLNGMIRQQTNPTGVISDTAIQKVIMNSLSDGFLRLLHMEPDFNHKAFEILNNYFKAIIKVFPEEWKGHKPSTSRLLHGTGIVAMGYLMEAIFTITNARTVTDFASELERIKGKTAWTKGNWHFSDDDIRNWNSIQNVPRDVRQLSGYLVSTYKKSINASRTID